MSTAEEQSPKDVDRPKVKRGLCYAPGHIPVFDDPAQDGPIITETAGYIPLQSIIKQHMPEGFNARTATRRIPGQEHYFDPNEDPTRKKGFDLSDFSDEAERNLSDRKAAKERRRIARQARAAAKAAAEQVAESKAQDPNPGQASAAK